MLDAQLLQRAVDASGLVYKGKPSVRAFARKVLDMNDANARQVIAGKKRLGRSARVLCMLVVMHPRLVKPIGAAVERVAGTAMELGQ